MIHVSLLLFPEPIRTEEIIRALLTVIGPTRVQPGCLEARVSREVEEASPVLYEEIWNSWEELESHIRSDRYARILELMEMSVKKPVLMFESVQEIRGIEYVQAVRKLKQH